MSWCVFAQPTDVTKCWCPEIWLDRLAQPVRLVTEVLITKWYFYFFTHRTLLLYLISVSFRNFSYAYTYSLYSCRAGSGHGSKLWTRFQLCPDLIYRLPKSWEIWHIPNSTNTSCFFLGGGGGGERGLRLRLCNALYAHFMLVSNRVEWKQARDTSYL